MEQVRPIVTHSSTSRIDTDEIESVSHAKQVGSMAWDFRSGRVRGKPLAPEWEIDNDWGKHGEPSLSVMDSALERVMHF
ncbi:MAG: hypothetical protein Kow00120_15520 [Anaerolineae bacterium]